jgi:outer membrane lipoprotein SlyB
MRDAIVHLLTTNEFLIGFIGGGVVFGFLGVAFGWGSAAPKGWRVSSDFYRADSADVTVTKHDDGYRLWVGIDDRLMLRAYRIREFQLDDRTQWTP